MQVWLEASSGGREEGSEVSLHSADCLGRAVPRLVLPCCLLSSCHILHIGTTPALFSTGFPALLCSQTGVQCVSDQLPLFDPSSGGSGICLVSMCISIPLNRNAAEVKLYAFFFLLPLLPWWLRSPAKRLCSSS